MLRKPAPGVRNSRWLSSVEDTRRSSDAQDAEPVANNNATGVSVVVGYPFTEIPALSQFGLMLLSLLVGLMGFVAVRRQA